MSSWSVRRIMNSALQNFYRGTATVIVKIIRWLPVIFQLDDNFWSLQLQDSRWPPQCCIKIQSLRLKLVAVNSHDAHKLVLVLAGS